MLLEWDSFPPSFIVLKVELQLNPRGDCRGSLTIGERWSTAESVPSWNVSVKRDYSPASLVLPLQCELASAACFDTTLVTTYTWACVGKNVGGDRKVELK